ncbi:hypothetical protein EsH8_III_001551 [Colletotrichum jinshuiense]
MLYSTLFLTALSSISCVLAMPAEAANKEVFPRGDCRDDRDDLYCGRGIREFTRYDAGNKLCYSSDNANRLFCAIREQQELARELAEEWSRIERCGLNQYYGTRERRCECYRRRDGQDGDRDRDCDDRDGGRGGDGDRGGDGGRGGDRGIDDHDPNCKNNDRAFCAASEDNIITYQRGNELCDRNRGNYVFCASTERGRAREKARKHFEGDRNGNN